MSCEIVHWPWLVGLRFQFNCGNRALLKTIEAARMLSTETPALVLLVAIETARLLLTETPVLLVSGLVVSKSCSTKQLHLFCGSFYDLKLLQMMPLQLKSVMFLNNEL